MPAHIAFPRGWRQAPARHLLPEGALLEALDVVPDERGAVITRAGDTLVATLAQLDVHSLHAAYTRQGALLLYAGAGTHLYRNGVDILSGLSGHAMDFATMRGFGSQDLYTFVANGDQAIRLKDDGTTLTRWGIEPPSVAPALVVDPALSVLVDACNNAATFTGGAMALSTDNTDHQTSTAALQGVVALNTTGVATKVLGAPVNLASLSAGSPSLDTDAVFVWFAIDLLANLDRIDVALNFAGGTQFITGYFTATIFASSLQQADHTWTHLAIPKSAFTSIGTAAGDWSAINGLRLQVTTNGNGPVTVHFNDLRLVGGVGIAQQPDTGQTVAHTYRWRLTFRRRPQPPGVVYGQWTDATELFTDQTGGALSLSSLVASDGHVVGATDGYFGEVAYFVISEANGAPVYEWSYWNGHAWVEFTPDESPPLIVNGWQRLRFSFPATNWHKRILPGDASNRFAYWIRMRATTPPASVGGSASVVRPYDTVVAAESDPSPASEEVETTLQAVALSGIPDPTTPGIDVDHQVTHVGIYRTVANQSLEDSPYLFEDDVLAGVSGFVSQAADEALLQILTYDNTRPPAFVSIAEHQQRIFGVYQNQVYVSKFEQPEAFPPYLVFDVGTLGDPPLRLWADEGVLFVGSGRRFYQIVGFGQDATSNPFVPQEMGLPTGLGAPYSLVRGMLGRYFFATDGTLWRLTGPGQGQNISDDALYQLFHGVSFNGVAPLAGTTSVCVSGWFRNRVYFSYPTGGSAVPLATVMCDEETQTWYRDSRAFRSFFYDRQGNVLYAGDTAGHVLQVGIGTTDHGAPIVPLIQSRDDDEGAPDSDKHLVQLGVDMDTGGSTALVTAILDYGTSPAAILGGLVTTSRQQTYLTPLVTAPVEALALGYQVTWNGVGRLYRLLPDVLRLPRQRRGFDTIPSDFGWPGAKRLESFFLDVDLSSGTMTIILKGDGNILETFTYSTPGRRLVNLLTQVHDATVYEVNIRSTMPFRLYPQTMLVWVPLPPTIRVYESLTTDLGHPGFKTLVDVYRDFEWVDNGSITMQFFGDDGAVLHTLDTDATQMAGTRMRLPRVRLPSTPFRLLAVKLSSTGGMRVWPGTTYSFQAMGEPHGVQMVPLAQQALSGVQRTPLVEAA